VNDFDLTSLLTGNNLILVGACFGLTAALRSVFPEFFAAGLGHRLLPLLPLILGMLGALMGVCDGASSIASKIMLGVIAGTAAGHGFKVGRTSILGFNVPTGSSPPGVENGVS
jgi:hypothetical protein